MLRTILAVLSGVLLVTGSRSTAASSSLSTDAAATPCHSPVVIGSNEVIYQIFPRSFYDSDGDRQGDLRGITEKVGYLEELGVTMVWLNPLFKSRAYHNYFADSFEELDPTLGTWDDFRAMCRALHSKGIKVLVDMETQYIADDHPWYRDAKGRPQSRFSSWIDWRGPGNTRPESIIFNLTELPTWDKRRIGVMTLNLDEPALLAYQKRIFAKLMDPNGDGDCSDGVDGFRMDHLMDDLDDKHHHTHLLERFWRPIVDEMRRLRPGAFFLVEPADWGLGLDDLTRADMSANFLVGYRDALIGTNKGRLADQTRGLVSSLPPGKRFALLLENHDTDRFASEVNGDPVSLRARPLLLFGLPGMPALYYGQELGARGKKLPYEDDGNDIPMREAFQWSRKVEAQGHALWYKGNYPWWKRTFLADDAGRSLEEQKADPGSLWHHYRKLISLRKSLPALSSGDYVEVPCESPDIYAFARRATVEGRQQTILVFINLSGKAQTGALSLTTTLALRGRHSARDLVTGKAAPDVTASNVTAYPIDLAPNEGRMLLLD